MSLLGHTSKPFKTQNTIHISESAFKHNLELLTKLQDKPVMPVLKANAYGHGLKEIATLSQKNNIEIVAVDGYHEALEVAKYFKGEILVMGSLQPDNVKEIDLKRFQFVVFNPDTIKAFGETKEPCKLHLEIDTGMRRQGIAPEDLESRLALLGTHKNIELSGIMTHYADADNSKSGEYSTMQHQEFEKVLATLNERGITPTYIHTSNSAASSSVKSSEISHIRPGLAVYGINPLPEAHKDSKSYSDLKPVASISSTIIAVHHLKPGDKVSYNGSYTASQHISIGVVPFGYYEGLPRMLSNKGILLSGTKELPIAGRICMNHTIVDITKTALKLGDSIKIISNNPNNPNSVARLQSDHGVFSWDLLIHFNESIRRQIDEAKA